LKIQLGVATKAYQNALTNENNLKQNPVPTSGIIVLQPALARQATATTVKTSALDHHSVRALLGLVAGFIIGVVVIFLLDALDKRLRTVTRTQETLGYPVLAEIPVASASRSRLRGRREETAPIVFATFTEPGSAVAEAYRMLRTAVLLEPIIGPGDHPDAVTSSAPSTSEAASPFTIPEPDDVPAVTSGPPILLDRRSRQVVLVVSAGVEPTRALVVTNLAAAFAEAGEQALIVTTADLRERDRGQDTLVVAPVGSDPSASTISEASRPTGVAGVRSLAFSTVIEGPGQLATRSASVLSAAREVADVIIVDAPLLSVHDAEALVPAVDVVVVVVESWWTRVDQATRSGVFLRRIAAPVLGTVLTEVRLGKKDLRRVVEPPQHHRSDARDEDEELLVRSSRMSSRRRRGQGDGMVEA
jgi:Mrp family chromosome partitioning ATPase